MRITLKFSRGIPQKKCQLNRSERDEFKRSGTISNTISHVYGMSELNAVNYHIAMGSHMYVPRLQSENGMKLSLILVSVVTYVVLATIWICYTDLVALY